MTKPKKIYILGTVGSGKSTLAKELAKKLKIKHYDLDDIFWVRKFNKKRKEKDRQKKFKHLCDKKEWIIEGVYSTSIDYGIKKANLVVLLKISKKTLLWRITKRSFKREKQKKLGKLGYKQGFKNYLGLLKATKNYYKKDFDRGYIKHRELTEKYSSKFIEIKNNRDLKNLLKKHKK